MVASRVSAGVRRRGVARNNDDAKIDDVYNICTIIGKERRRRGGACGGCVGVKSNNWKHGGGGETLGGSAEAEGVDCPLYEESFVV